MRCTSVLISKIDGDNRVQRICSGLRVNDYDVNIVCLTDSFENEVQEYEKFKAYKVRKIYRRYRIFHYFYTLLRFFIFFKQLKKISSKSDLLIFNDFVCWPYLIYFHLFTKKIIWYDCHEYSPNDFPDGKMTAKRWVKAIEKYICKKANIVTVVSSGIKSLLIEDYSTKNIDLLRNIPGQSKSCNENRGDKKYDRMSIIYQGIFSQGRGIERLIAAIQKEKLELQNYDFYFAGSGELRELVERASELANVFYLGWLSSKELKVATSSMHIGYCSIEPLCISYDLSLPNKFFQYCQAKIPLIVGESKELSTLIEEHSLGVVWKDQTLLECLKELTNNYQKCQSAISDFNIKVTWENDFKLVLKKLEFLTCQDQ